MRTKSLLAVAALLAAGAASSMAQSNVYSLNVVGYVNVVIKGSGAYNLLVNPLNNTSGGNGITNLFKTGQPDGANVFKWDPTTADYQTTIPTYGAFAGAWDINVPLPPGEAFFYINPDVDFTNTFVGEVVQGNYTHPVAILGGGSYNAVGNQAPVGGSFTNILKGLTLTDGDNVFGWDPNTADYDTTVPTYGAFAGAWDTTALNVEVGHGVFYIRQGGDVPTWVRNFTVQ